MGCPCCRAGRSPHEIARAGPLMRSIKMPPMRGSGTEIAVAVGSRDRTDLRDYAARIWATGALVGQQPANLRQTPARDPRAAVPNQRGTPQCFARMAIPLAASSRELPNERALPLRENCCDVALSLADEMDLARFG